MSEKKVRARIVIEVGDKNQNGKLDVTASAEIHGVPLVERFVSPSVTVDVPSVADAFGMLGPDARRLGQMIDAGIDALT